MNFTNHCIKRICQRNKQASFMTFAQLETMLLASEVIVEGEIRYHLLKLIDLVLVVNHANGNVVTAYRLSNSKFSERV